MKEKSKMITVTEEHLNFLDDLRDSGQTNMFGASRYIEQEFGVTREQAREILCHWMDTFSERNGI